MGMINTKSAFEDELKKMLNLQIEEIRDQIARGTCQDWAHYKFRAGEILGLMRALELLSEANVKVAKMLT
jgi:hypothetical protein